MSDDEKRRIADSQRHYFQSSQAYAWVITANRLKRAADRIYGLTYKAAKAERAAFDRLMVQIETGERKALKGLRRLTKAEEQRSFDLEMVPVYFMLCGMAFECALKAIHVGRGNHFSTLDKKHDLLNSASTLGMELSKMERDLLARAGYFVRWAARYPVPLHPTGMRFKRPSDNQLEYWTQSVYALDHPNPADELYGRLISLVVQQPNMKSDGK